MQHICSQTRNAIQEQIGGPFVLVSFATFEAHGAKRVRYTVRRPKGKKFLHLVGYENGQIAAALL